MITNGGSPSTLRYLLIKIQTKRPYAEYQQHSNCGREINFETEYAEYECRSETNHKKKKKEITKFCIKCSIICSVLILSGEINNHLV